MQQLSNFRSIPQLDLCNENDRGPKSDTAVSSKTGIQGYITEISSKIRLSGMAGHRLVRGKGPPVLNLRALPGISRMAIIVALGKISRSSRGCNEGVVRMEERLRVGIDID
jgi:hypothetical protein